MPAVFYFAPVSTEAYKDLSKDELVLELVKMHHELDQLKRLVFGSRHERFVPSIAQEQLGLGLDIAAAAPIAYPLQTVSYTRKAKESSSEKISTGRMKLPATLPREEVIIEPTEDVTGWDKIGQEVTEELERIPGKLFVRRYIRPKYARPNGQGVVIGQLPSRPIDKGIPGPGLLAQIVIDKYTDHLPVYRQVQRFEREGMKLPASTLTDWIGATCSLLEPLYELHRLTVLRSGYLQADETPIRVQDKDKKGSTHRGYHWVYHAPRERLVLFDYREGRGREGPAECLEDFKGYLQTDGYAVYEDFGNKAGVTLLHCMAHARRKFDEAKGNDLFRAEHVLTEMQKLYALERCAREDNLPAEALLNLRRQQATPILNQLKEWMIQNYKDVLPQSAIGQAIHYSLQRWDKLCIYTSDAALQIDNNLVENTIRPVAIGYA